VAAPTQQWFKTAKQTAEGNRHLFDLDCAPPDMLRCSEYLCMRNMRLNSRPMQDHDWHEIGMSMDTNPDNQPEDAPMAWQTPAFEDIRFGFEVTMYICNR